MTPGDLSRIFATVRERKPLVHHITNYVTVNDCANITLSVGAAPVMAHAPEEVEEMTALAGSLVLNIGTLDTAQVESMLIAGRKANALGIPVILDPVGAGATGFRTRVARKLLSDLDIAILKGNAGEIGVLAGTGGSVRGVDSEGVSGNPVEVTREFAGRSGFTVVMSGAVDIISDGKRTLLAENGHPMMGRVSGTGCMAASITGACAAVSKDRALAAATALSLFGIAGERAAARCGGPSSFRIALIDEVAALEPTDLLSFAKIRISDA
ncbi:MAG: hydroxyethylthiazole kinase [Methanoregulaceae archaeon]